MKELFEEFPTLLGLYGTHEVLGLHGITTTDRAAFVEKYSKAALTVGKKFGLNPTVILAQAAMESGWGTSYMAKNIFNFFGVTAGGKPNDYWKGDTYTSKTSGLKFRKYASVEDGFSDFARLITSKYKAASASQTISDYAKAIAYSPYISEQNGDNRENYRKGIINNAAYILKQSGQATAADALIAQGKKDQPPASARTAAPENSKTVPVYPPTTSTPAPDTSNMQSPPAEQPDNTKLWIVAGAAAALFLFI